MSRKISDLHMGLGPLGNRIYAGYLNAPGNEWTSKKDVTHMAIGLVAEHVLGSDNRAEPTMEILRNGKVWAYMTVRLAKNVQPVPHDPTDTEVES